MNDELNLHELFILAYATKPDATVKEFRQNVMKVAQFNKATSKDARGLLKAIPHISNAIMEQVQKKAAVGYQRAVELLSTLESE